MSVGLFRAAVAMAGHERRLDALASNIANLGTVGFKRQSSAIREFAVERPSGMVRGQRTKTQTDFSQGNLRRTGNPLDVALHGSGFFAVEGPVGEMYTRAGTFRMDENGVLVTDDGFEVAWSSRGGTIDPVGTEVRIDSQGIVRQGFQEIGQLKVVDFQDKSLLRQQQGGFWVAPPGAGRATVTAEVHQYTLEESNAVGVEEIVGMIGVQRAFESTSRVARSIQESYSRLTRSNT